MPRKLSVGIEQLRILCIMGLLPEERLIPQPILVSLQVGVVDANAFVDYTKLADTATHLAQESQFFLLEEYATALCREILKNPLLDSLKVRIEKPKALLFAQHAFIEMEVSKCHGPSLQDQPNDSGPALP